MTRIAVRAQNVQRSFGDRVVLDGLDLELRSGEFVVLLGRSGSGKSTLLRALAGLDEDVIGRVEVPARRAVVFQNPRLLPWKRVIDNVCLGLPRKPGRLVAAAALTEVGLAGHERDWPVTLSGGEAQRAALARALVRQPDLLLLDEPFGALDALTRIRMQGLLRELYQRHHPAVVLVTHDVDEALDLADRVVMIDEGRICLDLAVDLDRPRSRSNPRFGELRHRLLRQLGVTDEGESS